MKVYGQDVIRYVAARHRMTMEQMTGGCRQRRYARPRQIAMHCVRRLCPHLSYPAIGRMLGGRDHTTIMYGDLKIESLLALDLNVATAVAEVMAHFEALAAEPAPPAMPPVSHQEFFRVLCNAYAGAMRMAA